MKRSTITLTYNQLNKLISPYKIKIIQILKRKKRLNYAQLAKELGISCRETRRHTSKLLKAGILKKIKKPKERGSPVWISLK